MSLDSFLTALFEDGRVRATQPGNLLADELQKAEAVLSNFEQDFRREFPGGAPDYAPRAALWGATMFYRAAQFVVYRDLDAPLIAQMLSPPCPEPSTAAAHYSVDLVFRFLPDLMRLAKTASQSDPLVNHLRMWGSEWPLSSVDMPEVELRNIEPLVNHAGLLALYVDRILARGDASRLAEPRVRVAARVAVGAFPELAGKLASEFQAVEDLA